MRQGLVLLATFLQSLFNLFYVPNLIGLYALHNICQRQMLALAALNRRRMQRRKKSPISILVFITATTVIVRFSSDS